MKSFLILSAVLASLGAPDTAKNSDETGSIAGKIVFDGEKPEPKPDLTIKDKETEGCVHDGGLDKSDHTLLIAADGGVANVVLTIEAKGVERAIPTEPIVIDQHGCRFDPHVVVVPVGATLRFDNSDETNHNIHTFARKNKAINKNVAGGSNLEQKLDKAEQIEIKCDVHTWMKAYVIVTDATHWAVSAADGTFKLDGVPPGEYTIEVWHEELGKGKTESVTVVAGETAELQHELGAKKKTTKKRRR